MAERHANLGYMAVKVQADPTTAVLPNVYLPIYSADINTEPNFQKQNPITGNKFANRTTIRGQREHTGSITVEGEPNTATIMTDMLMTRGTETGSGPWTRPFTFAATDPRFYTVDISYVSHVVRYIGVGCSQIEEEWEDNELRLNCSVSALKVWDGREIASVAGQNITFKQDYDRSPTTGLAVGDILQIWDVSASNYINVTLATITDGVTIVVTGTVTPAAAGDFVTIRPATSPSFSTLPVFTFANTEYRFGATAAAALTAAHTPLEPDVSLSLMHPFEDDAGAKRSGSHDPAALPRMQGDYEFGVKKYFDTPADMIEYSNMVKKACVIRHFSYSGANTYEYRVTLNNMTTGNPRPNPNAEEILYSEHEFSGNYDSADAQGMSVTTISGIQLAA
jgi:hypothetical protein